MKAYKNSVTAVVCPTCQCMMPVIAVATAPAGTCVVTCMSVKCENHGKKFTLELPTVELTPLPE